MLLATVTLYSEVSNEKQLLNQTDVPDVPVITAPDPDFDAPFPSSDMDGGILKIFHLLENFPKISTS